MVPLGINFVLKNKTTSLQNSHRGGGSIHKLPSLQAQEPEFHLQHSPKNSQTQWHVFVIIALGSQADQPRLTGQLQTKGRPCLRKQGGWLLRWTTGFHMKILPYVHMYLHTHLVNIHKMETLTFLRKAFPWRNKGRLSSVLEQKTCLVNLMKLARAILRVESLCVCLEWILGFV